MQNVPAKRCLAGTFFTLLPLRLLGWRQVFYRGLDLLA